MDSSNQPSTRERILEAAREVFLERGFAKATIREICSRAGANVAAVHYHFQDKGGVYSAVLSELLTASAQRFPMNMGLGDEPTARQRLSAFINSFLHRVLLGDGGEDFNHKGRLIAEALVTRNPFLDELVEAHVRPMLAELEVILVELMGEDAPEKVRLACAASIVGQCLHYFYSRPVIDKLNTGLYEGAKDVERLSEHITAFSLGGMQAVLERHREQARQAAQEQEETAAETR